MNRYPLFIFVPHFGQNVSYPLWKNWYARTGRIPKIGNAIRTIDTWYSDYNEEERAIAIEPYGAVTNLGRAFRNPKNKEDFFTLFDKFVKAEELEEEQLHYVMAVLVRGGVFGESDKWWWLTI